MVLHAKLEINQLHLKLNSLAPYLISWFEKLISRWCCFTYDQNTVFIEESCLQTGSVGRWVLLGRPEDFECKQVNCH